MAEFYVGEIRMTASRQTEPPVGWFYCDGSLKSVSTYQTLYSLIGTVYGGDGTSTFGLPDYRSRVPIGFGTEAAPLTNAYLVGAKGGLEQVPLSGANMPAHTHNWLGSTKAANLTAASGNLFGSVPYSAGPPALGGLYENTTVANFHWFNAATSVIGSTGTSGATHENRMPSEAIGFIIAYTGVYPVRS